MIVMAMVKEAVRESVDLLKRRLISGRVDVMKSKRGLIIGLKILARRIEGTEVPSEVPSEGHRFSAALR